jgi:hypothetical protein
VSADKVINTLAVLFSLTAAAFSAFLFMDTRHVHNPDLVHSEAETSRRIMMSESTRYAEIAKYYSDRMQEGVKLTESERARLDLAQRQQIRIHKALSEPVN